MSERTFGEARNYDDLAEVLRVVASEREITRNDLDEIAGLQSGYSAKLLAPVPMKKIGPATLEPMLGALGIKLVVVEDEEALRRFAAKVESNKAKKPAPKIKSIPREFEVAFRERELKKSKSLGRKGGRIGGKARAAKLSPSQRSRLASHAARARWAKVSKAERCEQMASVRANRK